MVKKTCTGAWHTTARSDADVFRRHQRRASWGRDQAEHQRRDDHHAHVQRVDVADFGELTGRHEDDDRGTSMKSPTMTNSTTSRNMIVAVVAGDGGDVGGDDIGAAQVRDHPAERRRARHRASGRIQNPRT
jgi:hypothetical protein